MIRSLLLGKLGLEALLHRERSINPLPDGAGWVRPTEASQEPLVANIAPSSVLAPSSMALVTTSDALVPSSDARSP